MKAIDRNDGDVVFETRVGLGLRELDGIEQPPDVRADVLRRLEAAEPGRGRPVFPRRVLLAALLAGAVTAVLLVTNRGAGDARDRHGAVQLPAEQDPKRRDAVGASRLVYDLSPDDLQRWLAENRAADLEQLLVRTVRSVQQRLGEAAVVARGDAMTVEVRLADASPDGVAAVRDLIETPGKLALRAIADGDFAQDDVRFDMTQERARLQGWLDEGGRARLLQDVRAIADYRATSEKLRWFVHLVRPSRDRAGSWDARFSDAPLVAASTVAAHAESDWNGGTIPAGMQQLPLDRRFLIELLAVNMHEVHFRESDVDPASVAVPSDADVGPAVDFHLQAGKAGAFADFSEKYRGRSFAMIWNDEVLAAPRFASKITAGVGRIAGLSQARADSIASILATPIAVRLRFLRSERNTPR